MTQILPYQQMGTAARGQAHPLFAQTMGYVAVTAALSATWEPAPDPGQVASVLD